MKCLCLTAISISISSWLPIQATELQYHLAASRHKWPVSCNGRQLLHFVHDSQCRCMQAASSLHMPLGCWSELYACMLLLGGFLERAACCQAECSLRLKHIFSTSSPCLLWGHSCGWGKLWSHCRLLTWLCSGLHHLLGQPGPRSSA